MGTRAIRRRAGTQKPVPRDEVWSPREPTWGLTRRMGSNKALWAQKHESSKHVVLGISVEAVAHGKIHGGSMHLSTPFLGAAGAEIAVFWGPLFFVFLRCRFDIMG